MAVSTRLRFEVLRRDRHTCRYCGRRAPDVPLEVDHVIPEALGGSDQPDNLVTACHDCNAGKASINPDAELVSDIADAALRWRAALIEASTRLAHEQGYVDDACAAVDATWDEYHVESSDGTRRPIPRPPDWPASVKQWVHAGVTSQELMAVANEVLSGSSHITNDNLWRYYCGAVWTRIRRKHAVALELVDTDPAGWITQQ